MMNDNFDLGEAGKELEALQKRIAELEVENSRLKHVIVENELEEEIEGIDCTSIEEVICTQGIRYIGSLVEAQDFDKSDIQNFDTLYKTLRTIRGLTTPSTKKNKVTNVSELLKIVGKGE